VSSISTLVQQEAWAHPECFQWKRLAFREVKTDGAIHLTTCSTEI